MKRSAAEIVREYGPFPGVDKVAGVTYDGQRVWFGAGDKVVAFDPTSGKTVRSIDVAAHARAVCGASIRAREKSWSSSTCRPECTCRDSRPMAAIGSSAAEERAGR